MRETDPIDPFRDARRGFWLGVVTAGAILAALWLAGWV